MQEKTVLFEVLNAVSTMNQARLFEKLVREKGYNVEYYATIPYYLTRSDHVHAVWYFTLGVAPFITNVTCSYFLINKPKAVYVTIEGAPAKATYIYTSATRMPIIANSNFTAEMMRKVGFKVVDVIHHGIDWEEAGRAMRECDYYRRRWRAMYKDKVIFLYVGRNDIRKGLQALAIATRILYNRGRKDWVLLLHTEDSAKSLEWSPNVVFISSFGSKSHFEVLKMMASADYLVFPSFCEGFGLPVLEANAVGRPAIHCWFPPLSEFSSQEFNFVFNYIEERIEVAKIAGSPAQYFLLHVYDPAWLADMMEFAIDVFQHYKDEYEDYCKKAREHAKKWDYRRVYAKMLEYIGIK